MTEKKYIKATTEFSDVGDPVPAPYLRRCFEIGEIPDHVGLSVSSPGFYRAFVNGSEITKGALAPYICNPDDICYYDRYEISRYLRPGKNVLGFILGNGFRNPYGGFIWDFDKVPWRGAPCIAVELEYSDGGKTVRITADGEFRTHPSPIMSDELRYGETYDARQETKGWNLPEFDDGGWKRAIPEKAPEGILSECRAEPVRCVETKKAERIIAGAEGWIYDFGVDSAGVCTLKLHGGDIGQRIVLRYAEQMKDGEICRDSIVFPGRFEDYERLNQTDCYISAGRENEEWTPSFTYHGFRYAQVLGIREDQATRDLLEFNIIHSDLRPIGGFSCSDGTVNRLFEMVKNSDLSNFYYFPTDCPHREKNGWTGDAAMSADHMTLLYDTSESYREWLNNIRLAQRADGALPGIVPTGGWGFSWGNGPAWDSVLFRLPYQLYRLRGNTEVIRENREAMLGYLKYILSRRNRDGTVCVGLGDWAPVGRNADDVQTPAQVSDSIMVMDMLAKAEEMFCAVGATEDAEFARCGYREMRRAIREQLIDMPTATVLGRTQAGQALGLYYGIFEPEERRRAFGVLMELIRENNDNFDCGFLGLHVMFHVLSQFGESELAYRMICKSEYPSYGYLIKCGETSLPEVFRRESKPGESHNHHFFGDIARWFMREIAGLKIDGCRSVTFCPTVFEKITYAEASYELPSGRVWVRWERSGNTVRLKYGCPPSVERRVILPDTVHMEVRCAETQ